MEGRTVTAFGNSRKSQANKLTVLVRNGTFFDLYFLKNSHSGSSVESGIVLRKLGTSPNIPSASLYIWSLVRVRREFFSGVVYILQFVHQFMSRNSDSRVLSNSMSSLFIEPRKNTRFLHPSW